MFFMYVCPPPAAEAVLADEESSEAAIAAAQSTVKLLADSSAPVELTEALVDTQDVVVFTEVCIFTPPATLSRCDVRV